MRKAIILILSNVIVSYLLFSLGFYITSSLIVGGVVFDNLDDAYKSVDKTLWYVNFIVCPAIAVLVGVFTGCFAKAHSWAIAFLSTIPIFAYFHLVEFPKPEMSIMAELMRGGRYIAIATVTALLVSRLGQRLMKRRGGKVYGKPEYG